MHAGSGDMVGAEPTVSKIPFLTTLSGGIGAVIGALTLTEILSILGFLVAFAGATVQIIIAIIHTRKLNNEDRRKEERHQLWLELAKRQHLPYSSVENPDDFIR